MDLQAKAATFSDDGYCSLLSLADDPANPQHYVMLAFTNEPDEQDISMGMGGVHVDLGAWQVDGYDLVEKLGYNNGVVSVQLKAQAAQKAGIDSTINITVADDELAGVSINDIISRYQQRLVLSA
jgi:Immunity protein 10